MTDLEALAWAIVWADHFISSNTTDLRLINCKARKTKGDTLAIEVYNKTIARQLETKNVLKKLYNKLQLDG